MYEFPGNSVGRKLILRMEIKQNNMCFSEIICVLLFLQIKISVNFTCCFMSKTKLYNYKRAKSNVYTDTISITFTIKSLPSLQNWFVLGLQEYNEDILVSFHHWWFSIHSKTKRTHDVALLLKKKKAIENSKNRRLIWQLWTRHF